MTKGDLSGHIKSYHDTIIDKKYFAFSYGEELAGRKGIIAVVTNRVHV